VPPFHLVDAFTAAPFRGNPAGVVLLDGPAPEAWMAAVAAEVNASETAFVHPAGTTGDRYDLRWFTPTSEVDLCGHATLATAHVLWSTGAADGRLTFATRSGDLGADRDGADGELHDEGPDPVEPGRVWLDLPSWPVHPAPAPTGLVRVLGGVVGTYLGRTRGAAGDAEGTQPNDVVEVADEAAVRELRPDTSAVAALGGTGLIVTAPGDEVDLVSRYFAPNVGIVEDPVTGSAHATLGPLWAARLGRTELTARQLSARGGELWLRVTGDRVAVGGHAISVITGQLTPPG
jgi:predicted PhzF superfamily epimerase YddE/YHI9